MAHLYPSENPSEALGFLLSAAELSGHLDGDAHLGEIDGEVGDLGDDEDSDLPCPQLGEQSLARGLRRLPGEQRSADAGRNVTELFDELADDENLFVGMGGDQGIDDGDLFRGRCSDAMAQLRLR